MLRTCVRIGLCMCIVYGYMRGWYNMRGVLISEANLYATCVLGPQKLS